MQSLHVDHAVIEHDGGGSLIRVGTHRILLDDHGFATLRFAGPSNRHRAISAVDILNGRFDRRDLAGKIVFIGSSAVGLNDVHTTAVDPRFPGLKVQALAAGNLLDDAFIRMPAWAPAASFVACIVVGAIVSSLFVFASEILWVLLGTLLCGAVTLLGAMLAYASRRPLRESRRAAVDRRDPVRVVRDGARFAIEKRRALRWLKQLHNTRQVTIESMASVAETRDPETGAHIKRTQHYVKAIAEELRRSGQHRETLTDEYIDLLFISAPLHDIGKVGVPDHILLKPGPPDTGRVGDHEAACGVRPQDHLQFGEAHRRRQLPDPGRRDRGDASREVGRHRLPARPRRRGDPAVGPHHGDGRHLRRADQPALLQGTVQPRTRDVADARGARERSSIRPCWTRSSASRPRSWRSRRSTATTRTCTPAVATRSWCRTTWSSRSWARDRSSAVRIVVRFARPATSRIRQVGGEQPLRRCDRPKGFSRRSILR